MVSNNCYRLGELAELLQVDLVGDARCEIDGLATLKSASQGKLSFLSNSAYIPQLQDTAASAVILSEKHAHAYEGNKLLAVAPYVTFARATALFKNNAAIRPGIHESAVIDSSASIAASAQIGPNVCVGADSVVGENCVVEAGSVLGKGCILGADSHLHANVVCYDDVKLGERVEVHSASILGADGFGFAFDGEKSVKIHQLGGLTVCDDVEIGAGTTIDRGALDDTFIGEGVKIDNQVQIGHNCKIGAHTVICGCTALAGSVSIGKYCIMGGASGAVGHITIADRVQVSAMSLVSKSIDEAGMYSSGTGHMKTAAWKRNIVRFHQLDDLAKRIGKLEKPS